MWILSDNTRHAYNSLSHDTEHAVILSVGVFDTDARILQNHDRRLETHMGGTDGKAASTTVCMRALDRGAPSWG